MRVVDLAQAAGEHDRLDPLPALPGSAVGARNPQPKGPRVPRDERLPELVPVVAGAVGRVDQDLQRARKVGRVSEGGVLRGRRRRSASLVEVEVADTVAGGRRAHHRPDPRRVSVPDPSPGARLRARVGGHGAGEVVGLGRQQNIPVSRERDQRPRDAGLGRQQRGDPAPADRRRVVLEADHGVARVTLQRLLHELHQRGGSGLPVEHELGAEEPVARVLGVRLGEIKELDVGRVALQLVPEQIEVKLHVLLVERQAELGVDLHQSFLAPGEERDGADRLGGGRDDGSGIGGRRRREARERLLVNLLSHPVVHQRRELLPLLLAQRGRPFLHPDAVAPRRLEALDGGGLGERGGVLLAPEAGRRADGDGVGRPCRGVGEARADLDDGVAVVLLFWLEREREGERERGRERMREEV